MFYKREHKKWCLYQEHWLDFDKLFIINSANFLHENLHLYNLTQVFGGGL